MKTINKIQAGILISKAKGFFNVEFIKKDGSIRTMLCKNGVKKYLKGGELRYKPLDYTLKVVFDMHIKAYRMVNMSTVQALSINGDKFIVS